MFSGKNINVMLETGDLTCIIKRVWEKDKMRDFAEHPMGFPNDFNKFNN